MTYVERVEELFRQNPNLQHMLRPQPEELEGLADSIRDLRERRSADPEDNDLTFQLAAALISHSRLSYVEEGVNLMQSLVFDRWQTKWSRVVDGSTDHYDNDGPVAPSVIPRGTTVSRATAPPPSDEEEETLDGEEMRSAPAAQPRSLVVSSSSSADEVGSSPPTADGAGGASGRAPSHHSVTPSSKADAALSSEPWSSVLGRPPLAPSSKTGSMQSRTTTTASTVVTEARSSGTSCSSRIAPGMMEDLAVYHYYLSLGWVKLKNVEKALSCVNQMLLMAPTNKQGLALKSYIEVAERRGAVAEVATTVAGASLALAGVITVLGVFFRGRQSS